MRLNKFILVFIILVGILGFLFVGIKVTMKAYRYIKSPKMVYVPPPADVFVASSLDRVFLDGKTLLKPSYSDSVWISAAGHEYESFQVIVNAKDKEIKNVVLKTSDLVNPKTGEKIAQANFNWRVVGFVQTQKPYYPVKRVGLWPDPLIPVESYDVKAKTVQSFWLTVYVPPETKAGDYQGSVVVQGEGLSPKTIPVGLHVYGFTLPVANHLKTAFDFYGHITKVQYPQSDHEENVAYEARIADLNEKYIQEMLRYRMEPILNVDPSSEADLAKVDRYMVLGLNHFSIGKKGGTFDNNWPKTDEEIEKLLPLYQGYGETLKLNHMLDHQYIYTWDEADMGSPRIAKIASMIHRAYPGLKNMVCFHGIWDSNRDPDWVKDIDIWTFQIDDYAEGNFNKLKKLGIEMWMYISGPSGTGSPNLAMDFDSIDYRIAPWMCWKYDIKGFLYWCVNWWPTVDPFKDAKNTKWDQNGNGLLFYPGPDGPWVSLRMEIFRDGMEDYEYIQALIGRLRILKQKGIDDRSKDLYNQSIGHLTMDDSLIRSFTVFNKNGEDLKGRRNAIAEQIERIDTYLKETAP